MRFNTLQNFRSVFKRKDFGYITDGNNIDAVCGFIRNIRQLNDAKDALAFLKAYRERLYSFYVWLNCQLPDVINGFMKASRTLTTCVNILEGYAESKRRKISGNILRGLEKDFLSGFVDMQNGIKAAFNPDVLAVTGIGKEQIITYFLDKREGLGARFSFNKNGKFAFARRLQEIGKDMLVIALRFLIRPSGLRTVNGWLVMGSGGDPVRILADTGRKRIYFLFLARHEHRAYDAALNAGIRAAAFEPS